MLIQGGMKAVVYTDMFQMVIIYSAIIMLIVEGSLEVGSMGKVWDIADTGGRLEFDKYVGLHDLQKFT